MKLPAGIIFGSIPGFAAIRTASPEETQSVLAPARNSYTGFLIRHPELDVYTFSSGSLKHYTLHLVIFFSNFFTYVCFSSSADIP